MQLIWFCETTIRFVTVRRVDPWENFAIAPFTNPAPDMVVEIDDPVIPTFGLMPVTVAAAPGVGIAVGTYVGIPPAKSVETRTVCDDPLLKIICTFPGSDPLL
jgi:hypothetical protein